MSAYRDTSSGLVKRRTEATREAASNNKQQSDTETSDAEK